MTHALDTATDRMLRILRGELSSLQTADLSEADWQAILDAARRHGILPLLFHAIRKDGTSHPVPPAVMDTLRKAFLGTAVANAHRFHFLHEIAAAFNARSIPLILLKGAHLAQFVYPDTGLRPMCDLDILIPAADLYPAAECLLKMGYGFRDYGTGQIVPDNPRNYPVPSGQMHFRALYHRSSGNAVELHCAITYASSPFFIDTAGIWDRARSVRMGEVEACTMHPEDLLLHLCLHLAYQHQFDGTSLRALCDIKAVLADSEIDGDRLVHRAREWRVHRALFMCLDLAHRILGVPQAEALLGKAGEGEVDPAMTDAILHRLFAEGDPQETPPPYMPGLRETKGVAEKIRFFLKAVFPNREVIGVRFLVPPTSRRVYLYYAVRMIEFVRDHTADVWHLLRGDRAMEAGMDRKIENVRLRRWLEGR